MYRSIRIENFRRFRRFELHDLGRVNLLVGRNNSGKTSILEAAHLLAALGDPQALYGPLLRRGERLFGTGSEGPETELDLCRFFRGHTIAPNRSLTVAGDDGGGEETVSLTVYKGASGWGLRWEWSPSASPSGKSLQVLGISSFGGLSLARLRELEPPRVRNDDRNPRPVLFEWPSFSVGEVISRFNEVVLTPEESILLDALRLIEPSLERIALVTDNQTVLGETPRGGLFVRCRDSDQRIPIGSMGDGMWRILGLTLALVRAGKGLLLIDEIDAGFHFTVLEEVWRLVCETANKLDVQVFATTHNSDCWTSLATVIRESGVDPPEVSIQRIEADKSRAIAFSAEEMIIAAERGIEVR